MTTAFVLSGGGSLGAVQVGMLQSLRDRGLEPDVLIGTSAGALNAAYVADRGFTRDALHGLATVWRRLRRRDVFPFQPARHARALAGAAPSWCSSDAFRNLVVGNLRLHRLEQARLPLHVVATDFLTGHEVLLSTGDAASAVMASAAIPGILPAIERQGRFLVDGGAANHAPVSQAVELGADRVVVLPAGYACALDRPPRSALAAALHALTLLIEQRLILDVARLSQSVELVVLPPLCPLTVPSSDFRHADELIDRARRGTSEWLASGGTDRPHPEQFLGLHRHRGQVPVTSATDPEAA